MSSPDAIHQIYQNGYQKQLLQDKENLIIEEARKLKATHLSFLLTLTKITFPPDEVLRILMEVVKTVSPDLVLYKKCATIFQELAPQLDIEQIVEKFPNEDQVTRGLIIGIIPIPVDPQYIRFVFQAATSQFVINRIAFLKYIERCIDTQIPPDYTRLFCGVLESLSNDQSPYVRAAWVKPALYFLKDNPHIKGFIKRMTDPSEAVEVRISMALNFKAVYELSSVSALRLLISTEPRVIVAFLPHIEQYNFTYEQLRPIYECVDTTVRVFIVRYLGFKKKELIDEYILSESNEVINETTKWLGKHPEYASYIIKLIDITKSKEKTDQLNWRTNYELLSIPKETILAVGPPMYELAEQCVFRHPQILMKKACEVIMIFSEDSVDYIKRKFEIVRKLKSMNTNYANIGVSILDPENN